MHELAYAAVRPALAWVVGEPPAPLDARLLPLLSGIVRERSLAAAVRAAGISYRAAWGLLRQYDQLLGAPLVDLTQGRGAVVTPLGMRLVEHERVAAARVAALFAGLRLELGAGTTKAAAPLPRITIAASHDLVLAALRERLLESGELDLELSVMGSLHALDAFHDGTAALAGFHVPLASPAGGFDAKPFRRRLHRQRDRLIRFVQRQQGLLVAPGNSRRVHRFADIAAQRLRFVNRQRGSGTRLLIDSLLAREAVPPTSIHGYATEEFTHRAVAATIAAGRADAGFGLRAAAEEYGLGFVPLAREAYYLAARAASLRQPAFTALIAHLGSAAFAALACGLPGYAAPHAGAIVAVDEVL